MNKETLVNHQRQCELPDDNHAVVAPIHQSVKFSFDRYEEVKKLLSGKRDGYFYARYGNPTVRQLENLLAELQGTDECICVSSGLMAITSTLMALLKSGDKVLSFYAGYKPVRGFLGGKMKAFGVEATLVDVNDHAAIERELSSGAYRLVHFESPTNPVTQIIDLEFLIGLAKKHNVITVLDNTFAGFHNHCDYDVDIYIHSLTKFAVGFGDAMGGAILSSGALAAELKMKTMSFGPHLDPHSANLCLRGMKSYFLRYEKQCANAQLVAEFMQEQPQVERVYYPGLASHPQHQLAKKQLKDFGSVMSVDLKGGEAALALFLDNLKLFKLTGSLGSNESLAAPSMLFYGGDLEPDILEKVWLTAGTVRLSVGLEHPEDLLADLKQALNKL